MFKSILYIFIFTVLNTNFLRAEQELKFSEPGVFFNYYSLDMGLMPSEIKPVLYKSSESNDQIAILEFGHIVFSAIIPYVMKGRAYVGTRLSKNSNISFGWIDDIYLGRPISSEKIQELNDIESELSAAFKL